MSTCTETYAAGFGPGDRTTVPCERLVGPDGRHIGEHEGWEDMTTPDGEAWRRLWHWNAGGASGSAQHDLSEYDRCVACGVLYRPEDHYRTEFVAAAPDGYCFKCALWWWRAEVYAGRITDGKKRPVRTAESNRLQTWCPGAHGAYGGRQFVVCWNDGTWAGPDDCLWDGGEIPWWLLDRFPPNGTVHYATTVARKGFTDRFGRPLAYTGGPDPETGR